MLKIEVPYMLFFYVGGLYWFNSQKIVQKTKSLRLLFEWGWAIILFIVGNLILEKGIMYHLFNNEMFSKIVGVVSGKVIKALIAMSGIHAFYLTAALWCKNHTLNDAVVKIGGCGYGVYVIHQFILVWLYDYTSMPASLGTYGTPWVALLITVVLSVVFTLIIRLTKVGRSLL